MARAELRAAAGGAQPRKRSKRARSAEGASQPGKDLNDPSVQEQILRPPVIRFKAGEKTIIMPLEFTIEDVLDRGVFEDIIAFARLVGVELGRITPELETLGLGVVLRDYSGYLEAALMRSAVKRSVRELIMRIAHYIVPVDGKDMKLRPSLADLEQMSDVDYLVCALRLYTDALKRITTAKNAARTA